MANKWKLLAVLLMCTGLVIGGCNDKETPEGPGKPKPKPKPKPKVVGPKDVALEILKARSTGDGAAAVACSDCSEEDKAFMKKIYPVAGKMQAFASGGIKAYGEDAWMAAAKKADMEQIAAPPTPSLAGIEKKIQCKIEGDKATCTIEGAGDPIALVKKGGKWLALPDLPPKAEREEMLKMMTMMGDAMAQVTPKIGKSGVTADQVFEELGKALQKAASPPETQPK